MKHTFILKAARYMYLIILLTTAILLLPMLKIQTQFFNCISNTSLYNAKAVGMVTTDKYS